MRTKKDRGNKIPFGLIGAGRISQAYCAALQSSANAFLACVADSRPAAAAAMAAQMNCASFDSPLALAESGLAQAVIIATPPDTHVSIAMEFIDRGIPVLCEKPISLAPESASLLRNRSRDKKVIFTMASKFRYAEDVVRARNVVDSGILGEIVLFENTFMSYVDMSSRWNSNAAVSGGGVLIDNGTHSVDIMRYFIGPLSAIHVVSGPQIQKLPVEETVHVTARSACGEVGRMDLSWSINKQCDDYIAIYGSKGTLRVGWRQSLYRQDGSASWGHFGHGYDKMQAFREQIENFSAAVQGYEQLVIDATDAVASADVIQAGYQALESGAWVKIPSSEMTRQVAA